MNILSKIAFAKEITKTDCNYAMASFDVKSLFTNIPLGETIENCVNDLFFDKSKRLASCSKIIAFYSWQQSL